MRPACTPAQAKTKDAYLRKHYNLSLADYNKLREYQNYACAICKKSELIFKNGMAVDHNHKTGEVRGLLCWKCNKALGRFEDNDELVISAADYLKVTPVYVVLGVKVISLPGRVGTAVRAKAIAKQLGLPTPKRRKRRAKQQRRKRAA
jgi:hypothetical protein